MQHRSQETHQHLLHTGMELFSRSGYDATGVAEICQAAGVSKGAFYHHFAGKQALFMELLNSYLNKIDDGFNLMRQQDKTIDQVILQMAEMAGALFQSAELHLPIFLEFWTQANHDPAIWKTAISPYRRYQTYFAEMIQVGIQQGSIKPVDAQLASRVLVSLAVGLLMESLFDPQVPDWQQEARQSLELLMNGIGRSKG